MSTRAGLLLLLSTLVHCTGSAGAEGKDGPQGPAGPKGPQGLQGPPGVAAPNKSPYSICVYGRYPPHGLS